MKIVFVQTHGSGHPPLGLMYLASVLEKGGFRDISIIDIRSAGKEASPRRRKEYLEQELKKKPDIVGLTSTTASVNEIIDIGKIAKDYGSTVMFGGSHATIFQERILEKIPFFDIAVYGEADNTICEIVERIESAKSLEGINGVIYRDNGKIKKKSA